ncbi:nuclear transport factor 2 family protein [Aeromicrobium panaciterrae]|uniref:hypothetical protein n=1 Tax=Aeromicrobium panaciterrae TaxID=363861 RepID=UPI0031D3E70D
MTPDRAEVLALVRSSPAYVAAHDKAAWVGIFASLHVVEDPVGARPIRSSDAGGLGRFWDAFIAPNQIEFEVEHDWVDGFDVARDVTIATMLRPGVVVRTPAHLLYETAYEDGVLKVRRMAAHWEPRPVYRQLMKPSRAHLAAAAGQFRHLFRTLGVGQTVQFVGASRFAGWRRKHRLRARLDGVTKLIVAGKTVTATCVVDGAPAAVIDGRTFTDLA